MNIPISRTEFSPDEFEAIQAPLKSGWVVQGPYVKQFEQKWSEFTGAKHSIAVSSCTTGLHLTLAALGIGPGDEVIVPDFTWVATANVVEAVGAKPILCDIERYSYNIAISELRKLITEKTKAIIPVHLFGVPANITECIKIAAQYKIPVIEDAACGFASRCAGKHVGTFGLAGVFSFHPRKAITTGEGGMIVTDDESFAEKLRSMRDHGASISDLQRHHGARPYLLPEFSYLGFNYRMTDLQAAIGSTQMDRASQIHQQRSTWANRYDDFLRDISWLKPQLKSPQITHGCQAYTSLFESEPINGGGVLADTIRRLNCARNTFMDYLHKLGIATRPGTHAVHRLEFYKKRYNFNDLDFPESLLADQASIALPLFPGLKEEEFSYICKAISNYRPDAG